MYDEIIKIPGILTQNAECQASGIKTTKIQPNICHFIKINKNAGQTHPV